MRKPLIATATACMLTLGLAGCGNQSNSAQVGEELDALLDRMSRLDAPRMAHPDNDLVYTNGTKINGVEVPGSNAPEAAYIDQAASLVPAAQKIAQNGNDQQKKVANSIIASIRADEGAYLITLAQQSYDEASLEISELRKRITTLQDIVELNQAIGGDRAESIAILRTGKIDATTDVAGLDEMKERAQAAQQAAEQSRRDLAQALAKIEALRDEIAEYESLELKLSNEALGSQGKVYFEKLDQATTAAYEAETAESKAELLQIDAAVYAGQAELAEAAQASAAGVADSLQDALDQIEQEKRAVAQELAALESERQALVKTITAQFAKYDAQMQARGFARMKLAQDKLEQADQALGAAQLGRQGQLEQLSVCLLRAHVLHQQALAARSYAGTLGSLAAAGPVTLGQGLHQALTSRIAQMQDLQKRVADDAQALREACDDKVLAIEESFDAQSDEGKSAAEHADLYRSLIADIGTPATGAPTEDADAGPVDE
ncbi:MAG: hypothetical protein ACE37H_08535 [Phycisphaeraceae bacterium]